MEGLGLSRWCHSAGSVVLVTCRRTSRFHIRIDMSVAVRRPPAKAIYVVNIKLFSREDIWLRKCYVWAKVLCLVNCQPVPKSRGAG